MAKQQRKQPRSKHAHTQAVARNGTWRWRARVYPDGRNTRPVYGPARATEFEAAEDAMRIMRQSVRPKTKADTLGKAASGDDAPVLPGGQDYLRLMLRRWRKRLDEPRLNGRALRHSLGTTLHALGVSMPDAMAWMGHSTTSSHIRYLHAAQSRQRRAAELLTEAMPPSPPPQAHGQDAPASKAT